MENKSTKRKLVDFNRQCKTSDKCLLAFVIHPGFCQRKASARSLMAIGAIQTNLLGILPGFSSRTSKINGAAPAGS